MHRMGLQLPTPSITWDRDLPEYALFERTLNKQNVEETDRFLTILDQESDAYFKYNYNQVADQFPIVPQLLKSKNPSKNLEGRHLLNAIILRSPRDSPVLPIALKLRGNCFYQKCCFEAASMDYEMFLYVGSQTNDLEELCEVSGNLVICYYLQRLYEKAKDQLAMYLKYKACLPAECFENSVLGRVSHHVSEFASELDHLDDITPSFSEDLHYTIPYKGFNISADIPLSSGACNYVPAQNDTYNNGGGVFAKATIPKGSIVIVELPIIQSIDKPFVQCEQCLQRKEQIYSCLNCRYKTYCSLKCTQADEEAHREECMGYKNLIVLILDASSLYRIFVRISKLLNEKIFNLKYFRKLTSASVLWEKLQTIGEEQHIHGRQYLQLLNTKPDYSKLSNTQYATLVVTAFRLTVFIEKKTLIMDKLYGGLRLSNKQKMIVIGSILMRLNCHLLNNTFDFEYNYPLFPRRAIYQPIEKKIKELAANVEPLEGGIIFNLYSHYNIDIEKDLSIQLPAVLCCSHAAKKSIAAEHTPSCDRIQRQLSTYKDHIAEQYFSLDSKNLVFYGSDANAMLTANSSAALICGHISEMCELERYRFVKTFARQFHIHFAEYFLQMNLRRTHIQQIISLLCTTLSKFRHSCAPNVEVIVMENGIVIGKALEDVQEGEELTVSFKAHYMRHTLAERKQFLRHLNLECHCRYCSIEEVDDICNKRLGIYCNRCESMEITPALGKCQKCKTTYDNLLQRYKTEAAQIKEAIRTQLREEGTERDLVILYLMSSRHASQCFVPSNEFRIRIELDCAKYLALKNYATQAFDIIINVKEKLLLSYQESFIWFTLYADIINILKIILYYNVTNKFYTISISSLETLCNLGLHIIRGQLNHIQLYETLESECTPIVRDLHLFLDWRDDISFIELFPLLNNIQLKKKKTCRKREKLNAQLECLPSLSKTRA